MMKQFFLWMMVGSAILSSSCSKKSETIQDQQNRVASMLEKSIWRMGTAARNGVDLSADYNNFTLKFSQGTYSTTNGDLSWPASGTWTFQQGSLTKVIRDGNIPVDINLSADGRSLTLKFTINSSVYAGGRVNSLEGGYEFNLVQ